MLGLYGTDSQYGSGYFDGSYLRRWLGQPVWKEIGKEECMFKIVFFVVALVSSVAQAESKSQIQIWINQQCQAIQAGINKDFEDAVKSVLGGDKAEVLGLNVGTGGCAGIKLSTDEVSSVRVRVEGEIRVLGIRAFDCWIANGGNQRCGEPRGDTYIANTYYEINDTYDKWGDKTGCTVSFRPAEMFGSGIAEFYNLQTNITMNIDRIALHNNRLQRFEQDFQGCN
jgi:hypothetical protein